MFGRDAHLIGTRSLGRERGDWINMERDDRYSIICRDSVGVPYACVKRINV